MPTGGSGIRAHQGFTLLEILVVMLLLSVMIAGAVLSLGDGGREALLQQEARRLQQLMTLAGEEAVLQSRESGVLLQQQGYRFVQFDGVLWQESRDHLFRPRELPSGMVLELYLDGMLIPLPLLAPEMDGDNPLRPQILLLSSGERSPFELGLVWNTPPTLAYRLHGPMLGAIRLEREDGSW